MIHPDDRDYSESAMNETLLALNSGEFDVEFRTAPIDDKIRWVRAKGKAYFNEEGVSTRFVGTLLDITAKKLIDEATDELLRKKDEFISIASHELKTPITSLKAALQMIARTAPQSEEMKLAQGFVNKAIKQVDKLIDLVKDLLDVTKIQAGKLELQKINFVLADLITECCEELQSTSANHEIIIEGDANLEINADRNRLEQVVINLLSNAFKYSPEGKKVVITVSTVDGHVKVAIKDFGIGIAPDKLPYVFDRFYRVDENSKKYAGLGLGLYISAEIVKRHNGQIGIESEEGEGSTFWFTVPV